MSELFRITIDVGPSTSLVVLADLMRALQVVTDQAMVVAAAIARNEAEQSVAERLRDAGFEGLMSTLPRQEQTVLLSDFEALADSEQLVNTLISEFAGRAQQAGARQSYRDAALLALAVEPAGGLPMPWQSALSRIVAGEIERRLPEHACSVRSVRYGSPLEVTLMAVGTGAGGLGYLLRVITTLGPRRQREMIRAETERLVQSYRAQDVKNIVEFKNEVRKQILADIANGSIRLSRDDITEALLDRIAGAVDTLTEREFSYSQSSEVA